MLGVLPFVEDPDLSVSAARVLAQHLPFCDQSLTHLTSIVSGDAKNKARASSEASSSS